MTRPSPLLLTTTMTPAGIVARSGADLRVLELRPHEFTQGPEDDASTFPIGAVVDVRSHDLALSRGRATVLDNTDGRLALSSPITATSGDVVLLGEAMP
jgi:hypothetical protein